jgi:hypothetical protein
MKSSDIDDQHVIDLAQKWRDSALGPGVVMALVAEGVPEKLAFAKVERLVSRGFLDYGTSAYHAWPTGKKLLARGDEDRG